MCDSSKHFLIKKNLMIYQALYNLSCLKQNIINIICMYFNILLCLHRILIGLEICFVLFFVGMCVVSAVQKRVWQQGHWTTRLKVITAGACAFIVLGSFIFGLTLSQSIIKDEHGVKGDKSPYTC